MLYLGLERNNSDDACHPLYRSTTKHITWEVRHDTGDALSVSIAVLGQLAKVLSTKHPTMAAEARRFVPGPNSGIDSVPRSMETDRGVPSISDTWLAPAKRP